MSELKKTESKTEDPDNAVADIKNASSAFIDAVAEKSYGKQRIRIPLFCTKSILTLLSSVRKLDFFLLPFLSLMYFCNSLDRCNVGNTQTDGMTKDLHVVGQEYSLLLLLFYIQSGFLDLPLNLLTKRFSGKCVLSTLGTTWGIIVILQAVAKNFAGMLVLRLLIG